MGQTRMGPPRDLILALKEQFEISNFIETGTFRGKTAEWASQFFQSVHSIEMSQSLYREAKRRLHNISNIHFHLGPSPECLKKIFSQIGGNSLFWLDAHWSGRETAGEEKECPLLEELEVIETSFKDEAFIFIDDARLFLRPPPPPHKAEQWPELSEIILKLFPQKNNRTILEIEDCFVVCPKEARPILIKYCESLHSKSLWPWRR